MDKRKCKTTQKQRQAQAEYRKRNPDKQRTISATFTQAEKNRIQATFAAHGVKPSEVLRGAAYALEMGESIPTRREPLPELSDTQKPD